MEPVSVSLAAASLAIGVGSLVTSAVSAHRQHQHNKQEAHQNRASVPDNTPVEKQSFPPVNLDIKQL